MASHIRLETRVFIKKISALKLTKQKDFTIWWPKNVQAFYFPLLICQARSSKCLRYIVSNRTIIHVIQGHYITIRRLWRGDSNFVIFISWSCCSMYPCNSYTSCSMYTAFTSYGFYFSLTSSKNRSLIKIINCNDSS